jgi:hypothetical protein
MEAEPPGPPSVGTRTAQPARAISRPSRLNRLPWISSAARRAAARHAPTERGPAPEPGPASEPGSGLEPGPAPGPGRVLRRRPVTTITVAATLIALPATLAYLTSAPGPARDADPRSANPTAQPTRPDRQAVDAILAGRARAVRDRDRTAFLATVASATPDFQAAQRQLFDNLTALPLAGWHERLETPEPAAADAPGSTLRLTLRYRLRGFDQGDVTHTQYLRFARRSGAWVIVGDGAPQGLRDDPEIWDAGRLTVVRGKHSLVIGGHPADAGATTQDDTLREIARRLDAAVPAVTGVVGTGWHRTAVALVPADQRQAAELIGGRQSVDKIAALATTTDTATAGPGGTPAGQSGGGQDRIVIAPGTFARLSALGRDVVLTHELTHVATGGARDGRTPIWLIEGLADYVGYKSVRVPVRSAARELRGEVSKGRLPDRLPDRADFGAESDRLAQTYEEAWLACRMIAERYGEAGLLRLYRAAGQRPETAFQHVLGVDEREFTAMWRGYLREQLT